MYAVSNADSVLSGQAVLALAGSLLLPVVACAVFSPKTWELRNRDNGIRKVLHFINNCQELHALPISAQESIKTWGLLNPQSEVRIWSDAAAEEFVMEEHPDKLSIYRSLMSAERSSLLRYLILLTYGGVYADMNTIPHRPVDEWVSGYDSSEVRMIVGIQADLSTMPEKETYSVARLRQFAHWTMAAAPGHPILICTIKNILQAAGMQHLDRNIAWTYLDMLDLTGPGVLTDCVSEHLQRHGKRWENVRQGAMVGDVLILSINGFGSNQPHSQSFAHSDWREYTRQEVLEHGILVEHLSATDWKTDKTKLDHGLQRHVSAQQQRLALLEAQDVLSTGFTSITKPARSAFLRWKRRFYVGVLAALLALFCGLLTYLSKHTQRQALELDLWPIKRRPSLYRYLLPLLYRWTSSRAIILSSCCIGATLTCLCTVLLRQVRTPSLRPSQQWPGMYMSAPPLPFVTDNGWQAQGQILRSTCTRILPVHSQGYLEVSVRNTGRRTWSPQDKLALRVVEDDVTFTPQEMRLPRDLWVLPGEDVKVGFRIRYEGRCQSSVAESFRVQLRSRGRDISTPSKHMEVQCIEPLRGYTSRFQGFGLPNGHAYPALVPFSFSISFQNTGSGSWHREPLKLVALDKGFKGRLAELDEPSMRILESSVGPGGMAVFHVTTRFTHAKCASSTRLQFQLSYNGQAFGNTSRELSLQCIPQMEKASWIAASEFPKMINLHQDENAPVWLLFKNTGRSPWKLHTHYLISTLTKQIVHLPVPEVLPGHYVTFSFDPIAIIDLGMCDGRPFTQRFRMSTQHYTFGQQTDAISFACGKLPCIDFPGVLTGTAFLEQYPALRSSYAPEGSYPRIIHQSWKSSSCTALQRRCIKSWRRLHPTWLYVFWSDTELEQMMRTVWPEALPVYTQFPREIFRADFARYVLMHEFGGVYADLDVEALQPFDALLQGWSAFVGLEPRAHSIFLNAQSQTICNAVLGSWPQQPFWKAFAQHIVRSFTPEPSLDPNDVTGPRGMQAFLREKQGTELALSLTVLDPSYFYPGIALYQASRFRETCRTSFILSQEARETCKELEATHYAGTPIGDMTYAYHHWTCSWC